MDPNYIGICFRRWLNNDPLTIFPIPLKVIFPKFSNALGPGSTLLLFRVREENAIGHPYWFKLDAV